MIKRVWSDIPTFKTAVFADGMNIVLADTQADSEETESTNGLGKTTLLRIIHFCLGSDLPKDRCLSHPELHGVTFGLEMNTAAGACSIERNTALPNEIAVSWEFVEDLPLDKERLDEQALLSLEAWRCALSARLAPEARIPSEEFRFSPTFRELAHYYVRIGKDAFVDPQTAFRGQSGASKRIAVSYLLGLNWPVQRELQQLQEARSSVGFAVKALADVAEADNEKSIGDLEADRVVLADALEVREREVSDFNLREDYHDLEGQLKALDVRIHILLNENHADSRLLAYYRESAEDLPLFADDRQPVTILTDAGALFQEEALRSLDEVSEFHRQVYANRRQFLLTEIERLQDRIVRRDGELAQANRAKTNVLKSLSSSGALDALIALQRGASDLRVRLETLKARIDERKRFDRRQDELTEQIGHARTLLKQDLEDRRGAVDEAIALFADYTRFLYGVPGRLGVDVKNVGYQFTFTIDRQGSDGVDQMVVFCFDLVVATLRARRGGRFLSLVHDSSLFADVDPRQYGLALQLAAKVSKAEGFQYICCLNVGALPVDHLGDLNLEANIKLRLTDEGDEGRLLGKRLSPRD